MCEMCMCLARDGIAGDGVEWIKGLGLCFTNPVGTVGVLGPGSGRVGWWYVCVSCESRWQVQVSVYCARQIHFSCTQCSFMLHIIDICFPPCICLWQISQIQTCLCVAVGPGFV